MRTATCPTHSKWMSHTLVIVDLWPEIIHGQNNGYSRTNHEMTQHFAFKGNLLVLQKEKQRWNSCWAMKTVHKVAENAHVKFWNKPFQEQKENAKISNSDRWMASLVNILSSIRKCYNGQWKNEEEKLLEIMYLEECHIFNSEKFTHISFEIWELSQWPLLASSSPEMSYLGK